MTKTDPFDLPETAGGGKPVISEDEHVKWLREGFRLAQDWAEVSERDGWHVTDPRVDWGVAEKMLEARVAELKAQKTRE